MLLYKLALQAVGQRSEHTEAALLHKQPFLTTNHDHRRHGAHKLTNTLLQQEAPSKMADAAFYKRRWLHRNQRD